MELFTLDISPFEVRIDIRMIAELMGVDSENIPEPYNSIIKRELNHVLYHSRTRGGFVISDDIDLIPEEGQIKIENIVFHPGEKIIKGLNRSEKMVVFLCTAGEEVTLRSRYQMKTGNMLEGYVTDIIGSLLVEGTLDVIHDKINSGFTGDGLKTTNRYSPGYCDWKVGEQKKLFQLFPENFCDVRLSERALMIPLKSISGVIGIGKDVAFTRYLCKNCDQHYCIYRNPRNRLI